MEKLAKQNLHLVGSAGTLESLANLIVEKLYWSKADFSLSGKFESRLGKCYDVSNTNGLISDFVVIVGKRASLYRLLK